MKKYILIFLITLVVFAAPQFALAANYFVGVTIASGQAPGYPSPATNTNWCLPAYGSYYGYGTQFYIRNNSGSNLTPVSPTVNPINLPGPACAGNTVWSGLFNLTSGTTYQAYFNLNSYAYCPGIAEETGNGMRCWVSWNTPGQNKSCADACSHYVSTIQTYTGTYPAQYMNPTSYGSVNCAVISRLLGGSCSSCTTNAAYDYYNPTTYACYQTQSYYNSADANGSATLGADVVRVCPCNLSGTNSATFTFNFTPTF
jgi:hypothetical protein